MSSKQTLLVTGFNGFVACHVANAFLEKGWKVRGTARNAEKVESTLSLPVFKKWVESGDLEGVIVEDFATADFSEILKGVDAIAHIAAPMPSSANNDWESYKTPTVKGTINLLRQAAEVPSVTAVGLMSSYAAMNNLKPWNEDRHTYTEADNFPLVESDVKDGKGVESRQMFYCVAKKMAEEEAEKIRLETNAKYSLARFCPTMTYGKLINITRPEHFSKDRGASAILATLISGEDKEIKPDWVTCWVHVDDVAQAYYSAITQHKNGRYLISSPIPYDNQKLVNIARKIRPEFSKYIPLGNPDLPTSSSLGGYTMDSSKSVKELGIQYKSLETMVGDVFDYFVEIGAIKA